jgi:hypothetical protein
MFWRGVWSNGEPVLPLGTSAFFSVYAYIPTSPSLQIYFMSNNVVLTWPVSAVGFVPETSPSLSAGTTWIALTNGIATNLGNFVLTNTANAGTAFYRLRKL